MLQSHHSKPQRMRQNHTTRNNQPRQIGFASQKQEKSKFEKTMKSLSCTSRYDQGAMTI